jgi:hypothetical protein
MLEMLALWANLALRTNQALLAMRPLLALWAIPIDRDLSCRLHLRRLPLAEQPFVFAWIASGLTETSDYVHKASNFNADSYTVSPSSQRMAGHEELE